MNTYWEEGEDLSELVLNSLDKLKLLKNGKGFKFNVKQCKSLRSYLLDKLSPYRESGTSRYLGKDVWNAFEKRAWEEMYRAVKEAETYLKLCSTHNEWMKCFMLATTDEAFTLHMHDFAWALLCLDLAVSCRLKTLDGMFDLECLRIKIYIFVEEMSGLQLEHFGFKFQDYWHLLMACNQMAPKSWEFNQKKKVGVLSFMERTLSEAIRNECKTEATTGISTWPQIPPKDLLKKRSLGEGSSGAVYEGSWLGHSVAIKDIHLDARDLFEKETAVLAKLQSPFIVKLIGTCTQKSHCYIVMELVKSSLDKLITNSGGRAPLPLPVAVDIMLQISRGMEYLHSQGIMHMDLKASNVLIEPSAIPELRKQGYGRLKLCDFGMASLRLSSFRSEDPKGTCYWRAPEAFPFPKGEFLHEIDSVNEYTYKADVYSFAMTCYEILTGKQPFIDVYPRDLYRLIVQGRRPVLQPASCPRPLAEYIAMCWETDPRRRPSFTQISSFMRNMKLYIQTMDYSSGYSVYFSELEDSLEPLVMSKDDASDESPADKKLESITRVLETIPVEMKRFMSKDDASDESPADKKLESITRVLETIPVEMKRRYKIDELGPTPPLHVFPKTNSFDLDLRFNAEILGKGRFWTTYRVDLPNYVSVAVKRLTAYAGDKRDCQQRFQALGSLKHTNLARLRDYYTSEEETLLIYDYYRNGSLYSHLHAGRKPLLWDRRVQIALDVALGLAFLHGSDIVHGNIKSSNILLDNSGNARVADYYLAGLREIRNAAKKSSAYMAPELLNNSGKMCKESDVYSFGVVLLELITGKNPSLLSCTHLPSWILSIKEARWKIEVLDARLKSHGDQNILGMLRIAIRCTGSFVSTRPTMRNVIAMLVNLEGYYS